MIISYYYKFFVYCYIFLFFLFSSSIRMMNANINLFMFYWGNRPRDLGVFLTPTECQTDPSRHTYALPKGIPYGAGRMSVSCFSVISSSQTYGREKSPTPRSWSSLFFVFDLLFFRTRSSTRRRAN